MRLQFKAYSDRFDYFTLMFDLLRHALQELTKEGFRRYMESKRQPHLASFEKFIGWLSSQPQLKDVIPDLTRYQKKKLSKELPITPSLTWAEYKGHAYLCLNASELILQLGVVA